MVVSGAALSSLASGSSTLSALRAAALAALAAGTGAAASWGTAVISASVSVSAEDDGRSGCRKEDGEREEGGALHCIFQELAEREEGAAVDGGRMGFVDRGGNWRKRMLRDCVHIK